MKEIAQAHGFNIETYGSCAGDNYRHSIRKDVTLKITQCKNIFRLTIGRERIQGNSKHLEQTLINHGL